ncbi:MAG: hypothetical protein AAF363_02115 [Bacteroidota bacterium]
MQKLDLHYSKELQGSFSLKKLNFLFVFQVNCPGCFFYGFPVVNQLFHRYKNEISFLGLSTAFEDFTLNTEDHTKLLLEQKEVVGETKKALLQQGMSTYPQELDFPIAMDEKLNGSVDLSETSEKICAINPNFSNWSSFDQNALKEKVINYLKSLNEISMTFTTNQLRGTPSFIIFNDQYEVLSKWFGHKEPREIEELIGNHLK